MAPVEKDINTLLIEARRLLSLSVKVREAAKKDLLPKQAELDLSVGLNDLAVELTEVALALVKATDDLNTRSQPAGETDH